MSQPVYWGTYTITELSSGDTIHLSTFTNDPLRLINILATSDCPTFETTISSCIHRSIDPDLIALE